MNILIHYQKNQVATIIIDRPTEGIELDETRSILLTPRVVTVLIQLLMKNPFFQSQFLKNNPYKTLQIELSQPVENDIDYKSCNMAFLKVWSQVELEDALHWMSTLGGAYSNLGDHSTDFAIKAGKNAFKQMLIASRSQDPFIIYKCWLFLAMSLLQQKQLKKSREIIQRVHQQVKSTDQDKTLLCMCQGIWSRLKYTWKHDKIR